MKARGLHVTYVAMWQLRLVIWLDTKERSTWCKPFYFGATFSITSREVIGYELLPLILLWEAIAARFCYCSELYIFWQIKYCQPLAPSKLLVLKSFGLGLIDPLTSLLLNPNIHLPLTFELLGGLPTFIKFIKSLASIQICQYSLVWLTGSTTRDNLNGAEKNNDHL